MSAILLIGDALLAIGILALVVFLGWWWLLPFAVMCGLGGILVAREFWADWR